MKNKILKATNGGLDVILQYYPQAVDVLLGKAKHFSIREQRTPSACIRSHNGIWYVTDFGNDSVPMDCINVVMKEEDCSFSRACYKIAKQYNIDTAEFCKPTIVERDALMDEKVDTISYDIKKKPSAKELAIFGEHVTADLLQRYNIYALNSYSRTIAAGLTKKITLVIQSNENYPIFLYDYGDFQKIFTPYDQKSTWRFIGKTPRPNVVYGLSQLAEEYRALNARRKDRSEHILPDIRLCRNEMEAVQLASNGIVPIWFEIGADNADRKDIKVHSIKEME